MNRECLSQHAENSDIHNAEVCAQLFLSFNDQFVVFLHSYCKISTFVEELYPSL